MYNSKIDLIKVKASINKVMSAMVDVLNNCQELEDGNRYLLDEMYDFKKLKTKHRNLEGWVMAKYGEVPYFEIPE